MINSEVGRVVLGWGSAQRSLRFAERLPRMPRCRAQVHLQLAGSSYSREGTAGSYSLEGTAGSSYI